MIRINSISKKLDKQQVLQDVNMNLYEKEIHVIYGKNGIGKTTFLKCLCGLINPDGGELIFEGIDKRDMGLALSNALLIAKLKVREYLQFVCDLKKMDRELSAVEIPRFIEQLELTNDADKLIEKLSTGNKSKVSLAAALICSPKLIILDEPFSGMDLVAQEQAIQLIKEKAGLGSIVVLSTHQADLLAVFADKVTIFKEGTVAEELTIDELRRILSTITRIP